MVVALAAGLALFNAIPLAALAADNAVPITTSISPNSALAGSAGFTLTVNGNNFMSSSSVIFNGSARSTTYISSTQLTASIFASDVANAGTFSVTVSNPAPGGGTSNPQTFTVYNVNPTVNSISPSSITAGSGAFTLTVNGNNFNSGSSVSFNGSARSTTFISSTQLTAFIPASDISNSGSFNVTVTNPGPGGGTSNAQVFSVTGTNNPVPMIASISPSSVPAGSGAFIMAVYGTNFTSNSFVRFNGIAKSTTYISPNQLTAVVLASDVAMTGSHAVSVTNPGPGGGISNSVIFTITGIFVTPGLPNTGFGRDVPESGTDNKMAAFIAIMSTFLAAFTVRKIWAQK